MEHVPDTFPWMFYGYLAIWGVFVFFLFSMLRRLRAIERTLPRHYPSSEQSPEQHVNK